MSESTKTWPKYSVLNAFDEGKASFDAGRPVDHGLTSYGDGSQHLNKAFVDGWNFQKKKTQRSSKMKDT